MILILWCKLDVFYIVEEIYLISEFFLNCKENIFDKWMYVKLSMVD